MNFTRFLLSTSLLALVAISMAEGEQQIALIGDLTLQSGKVLKDCKVGYRTFGKLNAVGDNAVLVPTWYLGTSADLAPSFKPGGLVNSEKYFVVAVDALTNGVSSSPSNSKAQRDAAFPDVTIRDMVESQHSMLLKLGIKHLRAVVGISMGGMQTFQWLTAFPDFMDRAVPIVGSTQPTSYDLMFYQGGLRAMEEGIAHKSAREGLIRTYSDFFWLALNTPSYYVHNTKRTEAVASLKGFEDNILKWNTYDMAAGMRALMSNDMFAPFGGSEAVTASAVKARVLVVVSEQDHCVNPAPALSFAKALGVHPLVLNTFEGHSAPGADMATVSPAIEQFLGE